MQQTSFNYIEIRNVGMTLNFYTWGNLWGEICGENWKIMGI